ncbi:Ferritin [Balamuthia mandrillaris]
MASNFSDTIKEALEKQIAVEFQASQQYLAASFWFESQNFKGIASYLRKESESERAHGLKMADFILKRGKTPVLGEQKAPKAEWTTAQEVWEDLLKVEEENTKNISELADIALNSKDHAAYSFLQFFVDEQVNAEAEVTEILEKVKAYSKVKGLLYHLDKELS